MGTTPSQDLSHRAAMPPTLPSHPHLSSEEAGAQVTATDQEISPHGKAGQNEDLGEEGV